MGSEMNLGQTGYYYWEIDYKNKIDDVNIIKPKLQCLVTNKRSIKPGDQQQKFIFEVQPVLNITFIIDHLPWNHLIQLQGWLYSLFTEGLLVHSLLQEK